jgi:short-subunit dehydrogenase
MGLTAAAGLSAYCASKWAAIGLHESLRFGTRRVVFGFVPCSFPSELRRLRCRGVHTTLVLPYVIDTDMFAGVRRHWAWLLPVLLPSQVAAATVHAVRTGRALLVMPALLGWVRSLFHRVCLVLIVCVCGSGGCGCAPAARGCFGLADVSGWRHRCHDVL